MCACGKKKGLGWKMYRLSKVIRKNKKPGIISHFASNG